MEVNTSIKFIVVIYHSEFENCCSKIRDQIFVKQNQLLYKKML